MKAYSLFEIKSVNDDRRVLSGMASTPTPDRVDDVVEPMGMQQRGPINLFLYHKHDKPVGHVEFGRPTKTGVPFEASIPDVKEAGVVRDRVDEAWHSVKYRLLPAVSIGFKQVDGAVEMLKSGGLRYLKWEILELSLVGVPANPDALIHAYKSFETGEELPAEFIKQIKALDHSKRRNGPVSLVKRAAPNLNGAVLLTRS